MTETNNNDQIEKDYEDKIVKGFDPEKQKSEEQLQQIPSQPKGKNDLAKISELPEEFNVKYIGDLTYLLEIFSAKYDKYGSLDYLRKMRDAMIEIGYPDGSMLNEFLFWSTMSRKMQIIYQRMHAKLKRTKGVDEDDAENLTFLKEMRAVSSQVSSLQSSLDGALEKRKKVKDVVDLHDETMRDAEEFIKSHVGEFSFRCQGCNAIVSTHGLPHFAIMTEKDDKNEIVYHVFSPEMWYLFRKNLLPLHYIAFILRTSPEGVLLTAEQRGEYGAQVLRGDVKMLEGEEKQLKIIIKEYRDKLEDKIEDKEKF